VDGKTLGYEIYKDRAKFEKDFNDFVENSVNELPDDANILDNPNFYLPIIGNQVPMIAGEYLRGVGGAIQPREAASDKDLAVDTYFVDFGGIVGNKSQVHALDILRTSIHEYGHTVFSATDDRVANYELPYVLDEPSFDLWLDANPFDIRNRSYLVIPESLGAFDGYGEGNKHYVKNLQTLYKGDKTIWGPFGEMDDYIAVHLINETLVRVRSAAGTRSNHNSLDDMFSPEDQRKLFQPKFIKLLNNLGWP
jgi:hypothetical protein